MRAYVCVNMTILDNFVIPQLKGFNWCFGLHLISECDLALTDGRINRAAVEHCIPEFPSFALLFALLFASFLSHLIIVPIQIVVALFIQKGKRFHQFVDFFQYILVPYRGILFLISFIHQILTFGCIKFI